MECRFRSWAVVFLNKLVRCVFISSSLNGTSLFFAGRIRSTFRALSAFRWGATEALGRRGRFSPWGRRRRPAAARTPSRAAGARGGCGLPRSARPLRGDASGLLPQPAPPPVGAGGGGACPGRGRAAGGRGAPAARPRAFCRGLPAPPPQRPPSPRPGPRRPGPERAASRLDSSLLGRRGLKRPQRSDGQPLPRVRGTLGWPGPRWVPAGSSAPLEGWRCPAEPGWRWGREESARGRSSSPSGAAPPPHPPQKKGNRPMLTNGSLGAAPQALGDLDAASPFLVCGEPVAEQQHAAGERKR